MGPELTIEALLEAKDRMYNDYGRQPTTIIMHPDQYDRFQWVMRMNPPWPLFSLFPGVDRGRQLAKWVTRKRRDLRWWWMDRHPERYERCY